ncbi:hypothetical protein QVD17_28731 [Tagetes erecta]|uniref:Uncharacterized protein n=1 Tax=Tagetes erecta TaxID=13708 RepID=A0AAD8NKQ1_TARER|nr:hypothetical protein QVD17_28731 [Tagetes erecta]
MLVQQLPPGLPLHLSMNLEALSLIHDVIVFFDVVAHKRLLGPLDTELNVGMGSVGIPVVLSFSVHASLNMTA